MSDDIYTDVTLKLGQIKSDYESQISPAVKAEYKMTRNYFGAAFGGGKILPVSKRSDFDIYGRLFLTRMGEKDVMITGQKIRMQASNSVVGKVGFKYNYVMSNEYKIFAGLGLEQEFDGTAKAKNLTKNVNLPSPSVKGNTRTAEFGVDIENFHNFGVIAKLDFLNGKKEGLNFGVEVGYKF